MPEIKGSSQEKRSNLDIKKQFASEYVRRLIARDTFEESDENANQELRNYFAELSPTQRANLLYDKIMIYVAGRERAFLDKKLKDFKKDGDLFQEIRVLFADEETQRLFGDVYGEKRLDDRNYRASTFGKEMNKVEKEIEEKKPKFEDVKQELFLDDGTNKVATSSKRTRLAMLGHALVNLKEKIDSFWRLDGVEQIAKYTDILAKKQYDQLIRYQTQLGEGFVWTPSREQLLDAIESTVLNGRSPLLDGETGGGKSELADAAAKRLTGETALTIACDDKTGERQMLGYNDLDPETGGGFIRYGKPVQAFTGFEDSRGPRHFDHGRILRLDEFYRLGTGAYSLVKELHQKLRGSAKTFSNHPILPGSGIIATTNPIGSRYKDRHTDAAMEGEYAKIRVDYLDQNSRNPEGFEFLLSALLNESGGIDVAKEELTPVYEKKEIPEEDREKLADGSVVIAKDELIEDPADARHGTLWRLANAVRELQSAFTYGNEIPNPEPDGLLRVKEIGERFEFGRRPEDGGILKFQSGSIIIKPGEIASWMEGYNVRFEKAEKAFHVGSFAEWIKFKIEDYLNKIDATERSQVRALFEYYHLLDDVKPDLRKAKPLTPKEIGYLSPRVPRPYYVEKPIVTEVQEPKPDEAPKPEAIIYTAVELGLDDGSQVRVMQGPAEFVSSLNEKDSEEEKFTVNPRTRFMVNGKKYRFVGAVDQPGHDKNGNPFGERADEPNVHDIFTSEEVEIGTITCSFVEIKELVGTVCPVNK